MLSGNSVGVALRSFRTLVSEYNCPVSEYQFPNIYIYSSVVFEYKFPNTTVQFPNKTLQFANTTVPVSEYSHLVSKYNRAVSEYQFPNPTNPTVAVSEYNRLVSENNRLVSESNRDPRSWDGLRSLVVQIEHPNQHKPDIMAQRTGIVVLRCWVLELLLPLEAYLWNLFEIFGACKGSS